MKRSAWFLFMLVVTSILVLFTASCTNKVIQSEKIALAEPKVEAAPEPSVETEPLGMHPAEQWEKPAPPPTVIELEFTGENIHFAFDSYVLSDEAQQILSNVADYLHANPDAVVTIAGHCDDRGTEVYNMALGERRAHAAKQFLVALGIGNDHLRTISYGEERPLVIGQSEDTRARNRRAEFVMN